MSAPSSTSLQERAVHDPPLAAAYQPGSLDGFDRLYRRSYARVMRMLVGVLRDRPAAEECTQDTFVRAFRAWPKWRPDAPAEAWLHRIALNVAISYRRREGLRTLGQVLSRLGSSRASTGVHDPGEADELLTALRRLPPRQAAPAARGPSATPRGTESLVPRPRALYRYEYERLHRQLARRHDQR